MRGVFVKRARPAPTVLSTRAIPTAVRASILTRRPEHPHPHRTHVLRRRSVRHGLRSPANLRKPPSVTRRSIPAVCVNVGPSRSNRATAARAWILARAAVAASWQAMPTGPRGHGPCCSLPPLRGAGRDRVLPTSRGRLLEGVTATTPRKARAGGNPFRLCRVEGELSRDRR